MKTIICGPPHSGKSVFISNLIRLLPSGHYIRINANGDGEGTWSNNPDQSDVMSVRVKGTNTEDDFRYWTSLIVKAKQDIVIVDIGGKLQDDKIQLFETCDNFVVVSSNFEMIDEWISFGTAHGCKCIGTVLSQQGDLHEEVNSTEPYVSGVMSGLERGHDVRGSVLLKAIANAIVVRSGFKGYKKMSGSNIIDMYELGIKLGMSQSWKTSTGIDVHNVWYKLERAQAFYEYLKTFYSDGGCYKVYGARSLWASCLLATTISNHEASSIEVSEISSEEYVPISKLPIGIHTPGDLICSVKENDEYALLTVTLTPQFTPAYIGNVVLPRLDSKKKLLLSGRMPSWLAMSIMLSYDNKEKYVHTPGIGFILVETSDQQRYGSIIPTPINLS